jgi:hypothetical protein
MAGSNLFNHGPDHVPLQANNKGTDTPELSAFGPKTERSQLGADFQPSDHSVICGRGRQHNHTGNRRFRTLASVFVERYSEADNKTVKAALVFDIITMIRQAGGHFCKYEKGEWFEVGDRCARAKVSAYFRDMLHTQYRSSAKAKTSRRSILNRKKTQRQLHRKKLHCQKLLDGTDGHSEEDDSSTSSPCSGSSKDSLGFEHSLEIDFSDVSDVFYSSISSSCSGSSTDSLGFESSLEIDFFDIDVF